MHVVDVDVVRVLECVQHVGQVVEEVLGIVHEHVPAHARHVPQMQAHGRLEGVELHWRTDGLVRVDVARGDGGQGLGEMCWRQ